MANSRKIRYIYLYTCVHLYIPNIFCSYCQGLEAFKNCNYLWILCSKSKSKSKKKNVQTHKQTYIQTFLQSLVKKCLPFSLFARPSENALPVASASTPHPAHPAPTTRRVPLHSPLVALELEANQFILAGIKRHIHTY